MKNLKEMVEPNVERVLNALDLSTFKTSKEIASEVGITFNASWMALRWLEQTNAVSFRMRKTGKCRSMEYSLKQVRP
jgi:transcription initiation factor IIE alpha subunit